MTPTYVNSFDFRTSMNNCGTGGTKVYKYQLQFINTELKVITGLTNIKR